MRVLVTGGAGFVGSHVVDALVERGDDVLVIDDLSTGALHNLSKRASLQRRDIGDDALRAIIARFRPDAIVHAAAQASVAASMADPGRDARTNILGGLNLIEAARMANCPRFLYITTGGALYGTPETLPIPESHPIRPLSAYGLSKWTMEQYLRLLLPPPAQLSVLRLANVYGPRQDPNGEAGVIAVFADRMLRDQPIVIHDDGEQTRDFIYAGDVACAVLRALAVDGSVTVNISSGQGISINAIFRLLAAATGYSRSPTYAARRPGDVRDSALDNRQALAELGWRPETSLVDGLRRTMEWMTRDSRPPRLRERPPPTPSPRG